MREGAKMTTERAERTVTAEGPANNLYAYYRQTVTEFRRQNEVGNITRGIQANLKAGGAGSLRAFLTVAEAVAKDGHKPREEALLDWMQRSFPMMWEEDVAVLVAALLNCVIGHRLLKEVIK